jgi:hypothetical protein
MEALGARMRIEFVLRISVAESYLHSRMALKMKTECEKCAAKLSPQDEAYICTFECTFCARCSSAMNHVCPNCGGELARRPRPKQKL